MHRKSDAEYNDLETFRAATAEADFLFGPEIPAYLDEIVERGRSLRSATGAYERSRDLATIPRGYDPQKVVDEMMSHRKWFSEQPAQAKEKFKKYLYIRR